MIFYNTRNKCTKNFIFKATYFIIILSEKKKKNVLYEFDQTLQTEGEGPIHCNITGTIL